MGRAGSHRLSAPRTVLGHCPIASFILLLTIDAHSGLWEQFESGGGDRGAAFVAHTSAPIVVCEFAKLQSRGSARRASEPWRRARPQGLQEFQVRIRGSAQHPNLAKSLGDARSVNMDLVSAGGAVKSESLDGHRLVPPFKRGPCCETSERASIVSREGDRGVRDEGGQWRWPVARNTVV